VQRGLVEANSQHLARDEDSVKEGEKLSCMLQENVEC